MGIFTTCYNRRKRRIIVQIFKGKTENEAIEKGLRELGIDRKHADITVLQEPTKGIFGVLAKEAEIEIIALTDEDLENRAKKTRQIRLLYAIGGVVLVVALLIIYLVNPEEKKRRNDSRYISYTARNFYIRF
ncbi:Jag N-terminal domain-containing protein [Streptococcus porci]|uniref:Jag N-terminal domain-containing protein n=1 Tax=Streptococcus porci TaxID=502567 RepID=UPI00048553C5|nr:Jag N-terminal domain-containing protein [Streptococcus porci]